MPEWQRRVCEELRELLDSVDEELAETIQRRVQPYFVLDGNVCALLGTKDHVNLFLNDGAIVPDPDGTITGGHDNKAARTISFYEGDAIPTEALRSVTARSSPTNRAGGWRKIKSWR